MEFLGLPRRRATEQMYAGSQPSMRGRRRVFEYIIRNRAFSTRVDVQLFPRGLTDRPCCVKNISRPESRVEETQVSVKGKFRSVRSISKPQLSQRRYTGLESEQEVLLRVTLPPDSMTSLEITRGKGRAWCLVRSRVIATSRFWELPFLGELEKLSAGVFFRHNPIFSL